MTSRFVGGEHSCRLENDVWSGSCFETGFSEIPVLNDADETRSAVHRSCLHVGKYAPFFISFAIRIANTCWPSNDTASNVVTTFVCLFTKRFGSLDRGVALEFL